MGVRPGTRFSPVLGEVGLGSLSVISSHLVSTYGKGADSNVPTDASVGAGAGNDLRSKSFSAIYFDDPHFGTTRSRALPAWDALQLRELLHIVELRSTRRARAPSPHVS